MDNTGSAQGGQRKLQSEVVPVNKTSKMCMPLLSLNSFKGVAQPAYPTLDSRQDRKVVYDEFGYEVVASGGERHNAAVSKDDSTVKPEVECDESRYQVDPKGVKDSAKIAAKEESDDDSDLEGLADEIEAGFS